MEYDGFFITWRGRMAYFQEGIYLMGGGIYPDSRADNRIKSQDETLASLLIAGLSRRKMGELDTSSGANRHLIRRKA